MNNNITWLHEQIKSWEAQAIISGEQANKIRQRYPAEKPGLPIGTIIFSGLGAVLAGLGIILLFAYNWHAMPKFAKLAVVFGCLIGSHGLALHLWLKQDSKRQIAEALFILGSMLFGAGIWLVAQIYHIDEHYPNGFMIWSIGVLAMGWALPSAAHGFLAAVLLAVWCGCEAFDFRAAPHAGPFILLLGVGGLAWRLHASKLLAYALTGFVVTLFFNLFAIRENLLFHVALYLSGAFIALSLVIARFSSYPENSQILSRFGWFGFLACLYTLTFGEMPRELLHSSISFSNYAGWIQILYWVVPLVLSMVAWVVVALLRLRKSNTAVEMEYWLVPLVQIACMVLPWLDFSKISYLAVGFNLVFLAITAAWMMRGCREGALGYTMVGSTLLALLAGARYFDMFESLIARGCVFVLVGGILFAEGIFFTRARKQLAKEQKEAA